MGDFKYRAFISYSWADAKWGKWLHHRLETYRTPAALVGKGGALGPVPARLHPLFKDREEEAAGASIGAAVEAALGNSEFLIVICSPNSAKSKWVEREIAWFKTHRDPAKVLALIVDGEPGSAAEECFSRALTHEVASDQSLGEPLADAPLAADARIEGEGKRRAVLKLAAAMLGVGLDELVNRDERRRTIRTRIIVAASLVLAAVMSTLAVIAIQARNEAEFQRNEADGLIEFMLTDLREKLEPVGRLDALESVGARALDYYAAQKLDRLDADALGRRANALLLVGEISNLRGDSEEALAAFREAAATTAEQLARDPDNGQRVYDHAQSVFWVGYIAYTRGELEDAEAQFREYQRLATRLVELDPANPDWQMESSYAETNMGVMLREQGRHAEAEPAFARGLERIEAVAASQPYDAGRQLEVGITVNWLGVTRDSLGKYSQALQAFEREVEIYEEILRRDPANAPAKNRLAVALQFVGAQELNTGDLPAAIASYDRSLAINAELRTLEPDNVEWQETDLLAHLYQAENFVLAGRLEEAQRSVDMGGALLDNLLASDPTNTIWSFDNRLNELNVRARLEMARGNFRAAARQVARMQEIVSTNPDTEESRWVSYTPLLAGEVQRSLGNLALAREFWLQAERLWPERLAVNYSRYILLKRLGRTDEAELVASELDSTGLRHPAYTRERS